VFTLEAAGQDDGKAVGRDQPGPLIGSAEHRIFAQLDDVVEIQREDILRRRRSRVPADKRSRLREGKRTDPQIFNDSIRGHQLCLALLN
jgi:hypothetical protein